MLLINPYRVSGGGGGGYDTDAQTWIDAVELADTASLPTGTKDAMNQLILELKATHTHRGVSMTLFDRMDYFLPMMAARTLGGGLVPVDPSAGSATAINFVEADYNIKLGLTGNASTKHVATGYNSGGTSQNDASIASFVTGAASVNGQLVSNGNRTNGDQRQLRRSNGSIVGRINSDTGYTFPGGTVPETLYAGSRGLSTEVDWLSYETVVTQSNTSDSNSGIDYNLFKRGTGSDYTNITQCLAWIGRDIPLLPLRTAVRNFYFSIAPVTY